MSYSLTYTLYNAIQRDCDNLLEFLRSSQVVNTNNDDNHCDSLIKLITSKITNCRKLLVKLPIANNTI